MVIGNRELVHISDSPVDPSDVGDLYNLTSISYGPNRRVLFEVGSGSFLSVDVRRNDLCVSADPRAHGNIQTMMPVGLSTRGLQVYSVACRLSEISPINCDLLLCVSPVPRMILEGEFSREVGPFLRRTGVAVVALEMVSREWVQSEDRLVRKVEKLFTTNGLCVDVEMIEGGEWEVDNNGKTYGGYLLSNWGSDFMVVTGRREGWQSG